MIKYDLPQKPKQLTNELQQRLTQEFKNTQKRVWDIPWLKEAVYNKSFGKCCYSDVKLGEESKYMEIEHFLPKHKYPDLVMEWTNLNPACKTCNVKKGSHDPNTEYIINPFRDNPKDYLFIKTSLYFGKNNIGEQTIERLDLNNISQFVKKRGKVEFNIRTALQHLRVNIDLFLQPTRGYINMLKHLMQEGNRKEEYAALISTIILEDNNFKQIEIFLRDNNLWDKELDSLKSELEFCSLPK